MLGDITVADEIYAVSYTHLTHFVTYTAAFFFHFGHRRLSLSVLVGIADGLIGKVFGFFENDQIQDLVLMSPNMSLSQL